jgi:hypothetical protein
MEEKKKKEEEEKLRISKLEAAQHEHEVEHVERFYTESQRKKYYFAITTRLCSYTHG